MRLPYLLFSLSLACVFAQVKPLRTADFNRFETAGAAILSPDGKWLAFTVTRPNRQNELRLVSTAGGETRVFALATQPAFSSTSAWLAFGIGVSEAEEEKLQKDKKPVRLKLGLVDLGKGEQVTVDGVQSFAFSPDGTQLAMRRYGAERPASGGGGASTAPGGAAADATPSTAPLIVRQLATGRDLTFGNVSEFAWQNLPGKGRLLAMTVSFEGKAGNGVHLFDPLTGTVRVLDSGVAEFSGLAWRKKSADLACLRSRESDSQEGPTHEILAWTNAGSAGESAHRLDPAATQALSPEMRVVAFRKPSWADDGSTLFVGVAEWEKKPPKKEGSATKDDPPGVDVWHWRDTIVMPKQEIDLKVDRERSTLAAWNLSDSRFVRLGDVHTEQVVPLAQPHRAYALTWTAYAMDRSIGRHAADLSLVDTATGSRREIRKNIRYDYYLRPSPGGRYLSFVENDHYWTVNTETGAVVNISRNVPTSFIDRESDFTVKQKPPFGVAGWTRNDGAILLYDKFDLWQVSADGSGFRKLTEGAAAQVVHRYVQLDPDEEFIDTSGPVYVSLFGLWTKQSGYARLRDGKTQQVMLQDRWIGRLVKARDTATYAYASGTSMEAPNYFVATGELAEGKKVSDVSPIQREYSRGRSELVEYRTPAGRRLQGALYYPADFEAGKKYPLVVYLYERLSDNLHRWVAPSERDYYNHAVLNAQGYFVLMPDIVYRPREPGVSTVECVNAALQAVLKKGHVDAKRLGVMGHSWGGFEASYLAAQSKLFAAAVAGAPITNLVSNYGNHHWRQGIAETDHIETGQQRMEVPLWEDLPAYVRNSAVYHVQNMTTPLLIEVGDNDGTVHFHQGVEMYNIARRGGKPTVLLVYSGEDHGLRKRQNQVDYQRRILAWFGHYLKGEPAETWITEGESHLQRQKALKAAAGK